MVRTRVAQTARDHAVMLDAADELKHFRDEFVIPKNRDLQHADAALCDMDAPCCYMNGNSLGLAPKRSKQLVMEEMDKVRMRACVRMYVYVCRHIYICIYSAVSVMHSLLYLDPHAHTRPHAHTHTHTHMHVMQWARRGVTGHFDDSARPWVDIGDVNVAGFAHVVGARDTEVVCMNSLTVNLHLLMAQFYRPSASRHKILIEDHAFPSDHYAMESQVRFHGYDAATGLRLVRARAGHELIAAEDILDILDREGHEIALVLLSGVQYYTGQCFPMQQITAKARSKG